jgi:hypothetical protein
MSSDTSGLENKSVIGCISSTSCLTTNTVLEEWNLVGLIGQVYIMNNQRTNPNWIKIIIISFKTYKK